MLGSELVYSFTKESVTRYDEEGTSEQKIVYAWLFLFGAQHHEPYITLYYACFSETTFISVAVVFDTLGKQHLFYIEQTP